MDAYGDAADNGTIVASGVLVSIVERSQDTTTPESTHPRVVRHYTGRTRGNRDIRTGDQLLDERDARTFIVDSATKPDSPVRSADLTLDLRRVT